MDLFVADNVLEKRLCDIAYLHNTPIGGGVELLPTCNMNCKMCYIRHDAAVQKEILSGEEWIRIIAQARESGMLFVLLTGGEPLLHPDFCRIYEEIHKSGMFVSVNTNGTLISDRHMELFTSCPPKQINISLYGANAEKYRELCGFGKGFEIVCNNAARLKDAGIQVKFNLSMSPYNIDQLDEMVEICRHMDIPYTINHHEFPPVRKEMDAPDFRRFTPEENGRLLLRSKCLMYEGLDIDAQIQALKMKLAEPLKAQPGAFACRAGHNGFWINWKGRLLCCGMIAEPAVDIRTNGFPKAWEIISDFAHKLEENSKCASCSKKNICYVCPAHFYTENGNYEEVPEYICQTEDAFLDYVLGEERNETE